MKHPDNQLRTKLTKSAGVIAALFVALLVMAGCGGGTSSAHQSSSAAKSATTSSVKKATKSASTSTAESSAKSSVESSAKADAAAAAQSSNARPVTSIQFTGHQELKMRHYDKYDLIDDWAIFTFDGTQLTGLTETNLYDETLEPEFKRKAQVAQLKQTEASYQNDPKFNYTLTEQKKDVYLVTLVYNLKQYAPADLLTDDVLKNGQYDPAYLLQAYEKSGYQLQ
ncbi:MAG: hypothetical protein LKJ69_07295 [Lactobacillus sp.]|nr:hypothetical protein [Lactobacillus sp.]MCI2033196.1 hypothetical protein [Lactobacillus sp.]